MYTKIDHENINRLKKGVEVANYPLDGNQLEVFDGTDAGKVNFYTFIGISDAMYLDLDPQPGPYRFNGVREIFKIAVLKKSADEMIEECAWWYRKPE